MNNFDFGVFVSIVCIDMMKLSKVTLLRLLSINIFIYLIIIY